MNNTRDGKAYLHSVIRKAMKAAGKPMKAWQIQIEIIKAIGKRYSESSVTARLREMLDVTCNLTDYTYDIT